IFLESLGIARLGAIKLRTFEQNLLQTENLRAVRIALALRERMVLAMHRDPFLGRRTGVHPEPEAEEVPQRRMKITRAMRLLAMEIQRDGDHRDVHPHHGHHDVLPETEVEQPLVVLE